MPKKNMGLGYALTRYHRIGLPDDPARVERDRPIECALCHADKTVAELVGKMERWWGRKYDRAALANLYGTVDARPLQATLMRGKAHEQAVARRGAGRRAPDGGAARHRAPAGEPVPAGALLREAGGRRAGGPRRAPSISIGRRPRSSRRSRACVPAAFPEPVPAALPAKPRTRTDDTDED